MSRSQRNTPHREMVFDPQFSGRKFKRFSRGSTSGYQCEQAYHMGEAVHLAREPVPARWLRGNPYRPGGRRWQAFEDGLASGQRVRDEERTYRRWNPE
jgi:heme oxygenase